MKQNDPEAPPLGFAFDIGRSGAEVAGRQPIDFMNQTELPTEVQSPAERAEIIASLVCLLCVAYVFLVGQPVAEMLQMGWAVFAVCTLLPIALTFTILHGSCLHREMSPAARSLIILSVSLLIFAGACVLLTILAFIACAILPLSRFHN